MNVFFIEKSEFAEYDDDNRFSYYTTLTEQEIINSQATAKVGEGDYVFIVGTRRGDVRSIFGGDVDAEVTLEITATR